MADPTVDVDRRRFVQAAALGSASLMPAVGAMGKVPPSERVRLGLIGCGGRGRQLIDVMGQFDDVEFVAVSDCIEPRMDQALDRIAAAGRETKCDRYVEHERILDRDDIDAVLIATTQHWHGIPFIQAASAGKHIYVEKPLSHTVAEGRAMVRAAEMADVVAVMGTQQRGYQHFQQAVQFVQSGRLGKIGLVECWNFHKSLRRVGRADNCDPPAGLHWDRWLGPAPKVPYNPTRMNNSWWFDYAGGMMTNWAIHLVDIILWAMRAEWPTSIACPGGKLIVDDMADTPDTQEATWRFDDFVMHYAYRGFNSFPTVQTRTNSHGICFHGTDATMVLDRDGFELWEEGKRDEPIEQAKNPRYYRDGKPGNEVDGPWQRAFLDWIKQGRRPPLEMEESHRATACCHLANIAYRVGRSIRFDAAQQTVPGNPQATELLAGRRRRGYELPDA